MQSPQDILRQSAEVDRVLSDSYAMVSLSDLTLKETTDQLHQQVLRNQMQTFTKQCHKLL